MKWHLDVYFLPPPPLTKSLGKSIFNNVSFFHAFKCRKGSLLHVILIIEKIVKLVKQQ